MADSRRRSAESSRLAGAKVRRFRLTADPHSTDMGIYFHCARTTKALRRISTRSRRFGGVHDNVRELSSQAGIIRAVGRDQIASNSFSERNLEPRTKFFLLLLVMSLLIT